MGRGTRQERTGLGRQSSRFWEQDISLGEPGLSLETGVGPAGKTGMGTEGRDLARSNLCLSTLQAGVEGDLASSGPQGPGNRAGGTSGKPRAAGRKRGWEGARFPLGDSRESQELRTSQVVGSCQYTEGYFPNCDELGELGEHCLGAASSMKEYSGRRDGNSFRPRAEQGHSRLLAQGP